MGVAAVVSCDSAGVGSGDSTHDATCPRHCQLSDDRPSYKVMWHSLGELLLNWTFVNRFVNIYSVIGFEKPPISAIMPVCTEWVLKKVVYMKMSRKYLSTWHIYWRGKCPGVMFPSVMWLPDGVSLSIKIIIQVLDRESRGGNEW